MRRTGDNLARANIRLQAEDAPGKNPVGMVDESSPPIGALLGDPARSKAVLAAVLDSSPNVILLADRDGNIAFANRALTRYFGIDPSAASTMTVDELFDRIATSIDDAPRFRGPLARIRSQDDLEPFTVRLFRPIEAELQLSSCPIHDAAGARIGFIFTFADVTEIRRTQAQLAQAEKMASLGMLVAGIAHEINTPIGAVSSMHDTLVKALEKLFRELESELGAAFKENAKMARTLQIIEDSNRVICDGTSRVTNIVRRLKSFARIDDAELEDADINEGIVETLTLIQHELKHGITVVRDFGPLPRIPCHPGRLNQVFLNLLMNARQAISGEGEIRISTRLFGDVVRVSISDTGAGIPQDNLQKIFDLGFTTKGVGVGTGLGLPICRKIVEEHRGRISVESEVGKGTTFTVEIPVKLEQPESDEGEAE